MLRQISQAVGHVDVFSQGLHAKGSKTLCANVTIENSTLNTSSGTDSASLLSRLLLRLATLAFLCYLPPAWRAEETAIRACHGIGCDSKPLLTYCTIFHLARKGRMARLKDSASNFVIVVGIASVLLALFKGFA